MTTHDTPEAALAAALDDLDKANLDSQQGGYFNMEWRSWPPDAIAAAVLAALKYAAHIVRDPSRRWEP